ncbi:Hsp70 family protein [Streptomyces alfalfae]|uniref:Hsp70 family protein n=1 Tax=Streptomyces alfalfae TaxID=1642299 RepID=A0A7T4PKQ4_9ACTN|nr:Hsp70 family protein [Streptomyces alfalfae]QQC91976.1 Hsp70 family protein [Streptomyces alfalfae]
MTQARQDGRPAPGAAPVSLGIDFGATGLRALFALPDGPGRRLEAEEGEGGPWLLCEPAETGTLPVTFPSLKSRLGSGRPVRTSEGAADADEIVVRRLRSLRERVEAAAPGRVAQTVISVPARFGSAQRSALRDAARAAGLEPARLVSDSMAAVIGHTTERDSGTCLVYGMGYEGFELGLIRSVRGHFRSLGYEGGTTSGGRAFDAELLSSAVRLLPRGGAWRAAGPDTSVWQGLRVRGQEAREALGRAKGPQAAVLGLRFGGGPPLQVRIDRHDFDAYVDRHVRRTLDRAQALLDRSGMRQEDVDTLLLVGGNTRMEQVRSRVAGLGRRCVRATPELLALGALKHALRLAGGGASSGPSALEEGPLEPAALSQDTLSDAPPLTATLVGGDGDRPSQDAGRRQDADGADHPARRPSGARDPRVAHDPRATRAVEEARALIAQGRTGRAAELLREIIAEAQQLLDGLERPAPPLPDPVPPPDPAPAPVLDRASRRQLARAQALLSLGHYDHAVQAAHIAWQDAATRPAGADMLDAMIDVHCAAAMADMSPEHFADAERWLNCAYGHDPTNVRVRGLLAERTYRHAVELDRRAERDEAIEALGKCLTWDPEHADAEALLRRLNRDGRNRRGRGDVLG